MNKCNYCQKTEIGSDWKPLLGNFNGILYIDNVHNYLCLEFEDEDTFGGGYYDSIKINYCPMCGRKL